MHFIEKDLVKQNELKIHDEGLHGKSYVPIYPTYNPWNEIIENKENEVMCLGYHEIFCNFHCL